jgi:antitoxin component YwqK of YwqJK toxin-antitoxin module
MCNFKHKLIRKNSQINPIFDCVNHYRLYFHENPNKINITYTTRNGLLDGVYSEYDIQGRLICKIPYKNGKINGLKLVFNCQVYINNEFIKVKKYEELYETGIQISTNIII